ncbi:MAG: GNAT family N-acetyltransferase [Candidatus Aminicenantes bacterium]|nr:GNAT family N-acetyltransferase [Candidatus Aminicenantes bacterium]
MTKPTPEDRVRFRVRDYGPGDFPQVEAVWREAGMATPKRGDSAEVVDRTLRHEGARLFVLEDGESGRLAGTSWMTCDGRRIHLHHFAVAAEWRGRGLAKILLEASLRHVRAEGIQVKLEVHKSNGPAVNLYRKAGFETIGDYEVYIIRDLTKMP